MKGQAKRFVDQTGKAFKMRAKKRNEDENIGFFDLWRYASRGEVAGVVCAVFSALLSSCALLAAIVAYGEITSLFVQRHRAQDTTPHVYILPLFGGGERLAAGNRSAHMEALVRDSVAFGAASGAVLAAQLLTAAAAVCLANRAAHSMVTRLKWQLLRKILMQEIAFFDTSTDLNVATVLTDDMNKLQEGVGEHVAMTAFLGGTALLGSALAVALGWQLALAGLALVPASLLLAGGVAKYQTEWSAREVSWYGAAARVVEEALAAIATVRAFGGEQVELDRFSELLRPVGVAREMRGRWAGGGAGAGWAVTYSLNALVFGLGTALCVRDRDLPAHLQHYHPGIMLTILFCTFMASQNIAMCQPHLEVFSTARGAAKSLFKLMQRKSRINALQGGGVRPDRFRGDIDFEDLYFNYPSRADVKVLRGFSLSVKAGSTVALVGPSGCGKSTVLQLLQRLYEPESGAVKVDGHLLGDLHLHHFRRSIGVVGQEPVVFAGSVRDNIALGTSASLQQVQEAAEMANAHSFISSLPQGYDTQLGPNGASLSGGQKQRLAIARALVRNPPILLLDEPTSALDPAAERQVQAALDAASKGRTTIVVSHRLSTIVNATKIVYMEQGAAVEVGTHRELLQAGGRYWRLLQADMTRTSAQSALQEEDEQPSEAEAVSPSREGFQRGSLARSSTFRGSVNRGSMRMGPVSMPDLLPEQEAGGEGAGEGEGEGEEASWWAALRLGGAEWRRLALGALASLLVGATMPLFALLLATLYGMFAWEDKEMILAESTKYSLLFLAAAAGCGLATFLQTWLFNSAGAKLTHRLRIMCFQNYLRQDQAFFDRPTNSVGALCARLATDCAAVQGATGSRLGTVVQGASTMVLGVALAAAYSWKMTLVSLVSLPLVMGGICLEGAASKGRAKREPSAPLAADALRHVRTLHALGVEEEVVSAYRLAVEGGLGGAGGWAGWAGGLGRGAAYGACLCAPTLGYAVSLAYGGYLIAREDLPYEYAVLVSEALIYGAWMLAEALSFAPSFSAARRAAARILAELAATPSLATLPPQEDLPHDWVAQGEIEFRSVYFSYPQRPQVPVLKGLSLKLEKGQTLALVGGSGCGKSTIIQLLGRSYDPDQGSILLDGRDIRSLPLQQLRRQLGLVQQQPVLFSRSLRDNLAYGDTSRDVPLHDLVEAAQQADIHSFIAGLPLGYDTEVGAGGLSGGQRQRVCIARVLLRTPAALLLDEPTAALDAHSEQAVQAAVRRVGEGAGVGRRVGVLVVAHRLATVRHADRLALLRDGVVAELGSHEELVKKRGHYWKLLQQQGPVDA